MEESFSHRCNNAWKNVREVECKHKWHTLDGTIKQCYKCRKVHDFKNEGGTL